MNVNDLLVNAATAKVLGKCNVMMKINLFINKKWF